MGQESYFCPECIKPCLPQSSVFPRREIGKDETGKEWQKIKTEMVSAIVTSAWYSCPLVPVRANDLWKMTIFFWFFSLDLYIPPGNMIKKYLGKPHLLLAIYNISNWRIKRMFWSPGPKYLWLRINSSLTKQ